MFDKSRTAALLPFAGVAALLLLAFYWVITNGSFDLSVGEVFRTLAGQGDDPVNQTIIFEYRLPRIVMALVVGFGLAIAGAAVQGLTKNGLADPGIIGITAGAGAGIMVYIFFFQSSVDAESWTSLFIRPLFGWAGGLLSSFLILTLAWRNGRLDIQRFILMGIAISAGFGSISMFLSLKMDPDDFQKAAFWLNGSLYQANWPYILSVVPWLLLLVPVIIWKGYTLDILQLGNQASLGLGVHVNRENLLLLLASVGIVSACVSISGNVAFVGLIAPHIARQLTRSTYRAILPLSGLIGMLLVLIADHLGHTIASREIPLEVVIAIIGVPYFIVLLIRGKVR
ncbi:FecCD family ABC transporter permease [Sporosarcina koreensis]|uniref:FecCD family ABC transporter permease n=1 Tax=Sporosarcina koreensis TaxID=334735 RepID=UPI000B1186F3|nr:iron ABC transporter permease [Sporosarcina koreensis]